MGRNTKSRSSTAARSRRSCNKAGLSVENEPKQVTSRRLGGGRRGRGADKSDEHFDSHPSRPRPRPHPSHPRPPVHLRLPCRSSRPMHPLGAPTASSSSAPAPLMISCTSVGFGALEVHPESAATPTKATKSRAPRFTVDRKRAPTSATYLGIADRWIWTTEKNGLIEPLRDAN
jgi:hypothetical protein